MKMSKKGLGVADLAPIGVAFVTWFIVARLNQTRVAIVLGMGALVLANIQTQGSLNGTANQTVARGITALGNLSTWLPLIAIVIAAAIIIGLVITFFRTS